VKVCFCPVPLLEERPYWEDYFELTRVQDAHDRRLCRDYNGSEPWASIDWEFLESALSIEMVLLDLGSQDVIKTTQKQFIDLLKRLFTHAPISQAVPHRILILERSSTPRRRGLNRVGPVSG
jgi:hypothetical protein